MTRTSWFDFGSYPNPDPTYKWDTKRNLFILVEVCAPPNAVLVLCSPLSSSFTLSANQTVSSTNFHFFFHLFIFIYLCFHLWTLSNGSVIFPSVSASMSFGMQNYRASSLSRVAHLHFFINFFHLFIFIYLYFHLQMFSNSSVISRGVSVSMSTGKQNFNFLCHPKGTDL